MDYVGYAAPHSTIHWLLLNKFVTESSLTKMGSYAYPYAQAQIQYHAMNPVSVVSSLLNDDCNFRRNPRIIPPLIRNEKRICKRKRKGVVYVCEGILFPLDLEVDSPAIASAFSLLPYIGFLYFITKSKSTPRLTLFGFYFLLAFVAASRPAGIYAKVHYVTSLSNVDWLHGASESLLMLTNLFIVFGLKDALRKAEDVNSRLEQEEKPSM